jgi:micrococcal nuclease
MIALLLIAVSLTPPLQFYAVSRVIDVYDGDTATLELELGLDVRVVKTVRLFGIDTPEVRPLKSRAAGYAARDWLRVQMEGCPDLRVITGTEKSRPQIGKYGRLLVRVACEGRDLNQEMIERGFAKPYYGGAKD